MSPDRMSGVTPSQQTPPGWFTSTVPSKPTVVGSSIGMAVAVLMTKPLRISSMTTWSFGK